MISIAPMELLQQFTPGQTVKLMSLITKARGGAHGGNSHPVPQPCLMGGLKFGKHFYDSSCWCAGGKCDRCKAPDCQDRNWKEKGREVP